MDAILATPDETMAMLARRLTAMSPEDAEAVSPALVQDILAALIRLYAARSQAGDRFPPFTDAGISATEVLIMASAILRTANVELFELGMWQAWAGSKS